MNERFVDLRVMTSGVLNDVTPTAARLYFLIRSMVIQTSVDDWSSKVLMVGDLIAVVSIDDLAKRINYPPRNVRRLLGALESAGWLVPDSDYTRGSSYFRESTVAYCLGEFGTYYLDQIAIDRSPKAKTREPLDEGVV